jgi:peptidyl-prolyl cis-trans isomerase C
MPVASINGVALHGTGETLSAEELRQRACTELLRQAAQAAGLLAASDVPAADGVISEAAAGAIEALLENSVKVPEPSDEACRRHYAAQEASYRTGEHVRARHILFAVTPGVDMAALRKRAESIFLEVRCHDGRSVDRFAEAARKWSNCPSGAEGGDMGSLVPGDCAPEFARELFGHAEVGVLPRLVHSRFGLHIVEVLEREPGTAQPFDSVRAAAANSLRRQTFATALRQYLSLLAGQAAMEGVELESAATPLVQ